MRAPEAFASSGRRRDHQFRRIDLTDASGIRPCKTFIRSSARAYAVRRGRYFPDRAVAQLHDALLRCELDCVGHQVPDDLLRSWATDRYATWAAEMPAHGTERIAVEASANSAPALPAMRQPCWLYRAGSSRSQGFDSGRTSVSSPST